MLDCANGATHRAAPAIFERLGAEVEAIGAEPDGRNINDGCGSTHLDHLAARVAASDATIGFAFDGDGDRVLAVDGSGRPHDGDELIALAALGMARRGELDGGVAVTVMSNYGFHQAMEEAGIEVAVTKVGDRYVLDELRRRGWALGGEQSGHIIDDRLRRDRRRDRRGADDDARARRPRPRRRGPDARSCRRRSSTSRSPTARRSPAPRPSGRRSSARGRASRAAVASCCAPPAPSRWSG